MKPKINTRRVGGNVKVILLAGCVLFALAGEGRATFFTSDETGTTAAVFLKEPIGARSIGMGRAFTAVADGPEAIWWNPAGMLTNPRSELLLENSIWMNEFLFNTVAGMFPLDEGNILGLMINQLIFNTPMPGYDNLGNPTENVEFMETAFSAGYATDVFEIPFGINFKLISSTLADVSALSLAGDVGVLQGFFKNDLKVGLSLKNFGAKLRWLEEGFSLPFAGHLGVACQLLEKDLTMAFDVQAPFDQPPHYHLGVELARSLGLVMKFAIRVGYHTDWKGYTEALNGLNAGFGWEWRIHNRVLVRTGRMVGYKQKLFLLLGLDYAWTPNDQLEPSHRLSLKIGF